MKAETSRISARSTSSASSAAASAARSRRCCSRFDALTRAVRIASDLVMPEASNARSALIASSSSLTEIASAMSKVYREMCYGLVASLPHLVLRRQLSAGTLDARRAQLALGEGLGQLVVEPSRDGQRSRAPSTGWPEPLSGARPQTSAGGRQVPQVPQVPHCISLCYTHGTVGNPSRGRAGRSRR